MRHVHLDLLGGLAGDMFLASALDCGLARVEDVEGALSTLGFGEIEIVRRRVRRGAFSANHIEFAGWDEGADADHRHLSKIVEILEESGLESAVRDRAIAMFRILGRAESEIHGIPLEEVHFHECGALDSIFDFVSAAWIIERADATWSCGPIPTGAGNVETDHGTVPVPVPATARLLEGFETEPRSVEAELVTPTGATILRTLRDISPGLEQVEGTVASSGYGAGTRDPEGLSNVVRMLTFEDAPAEAAGDSEAERVVRLVCEIDDMQPELLADAAEVLLANGALDVVRQPVAMKKGRQGTRLSVLVRPADEEAMVDAIFRETTTFGVRTEAVRRRTLRRTTGTVETRFGEVGVKRGYRRGELVQATPEYDDCRALAAEAGVATERVYRAALARLAAESGDGE